MYQGKSLCYQLPAVVLGGTTIVISPLIALMVDQVKALNGKGITAALISSGNGEKTNREIFEQLLGRSHANAKVKSQQTLKTPELEHITLLYVTPEQVQTSRFRDAMGELHKKKQLSLFAVDEAHWYVLEYEFDVSEVSILPCLYIFCSVTVFPAGVTTFGRPICV